MQIEKIDKLREKLMEIYVLFYLCIFPMAMHDKYFDILKFRFQLFWIPTLLFTLVFIIIGIYRMNLVRKLHRTESVKSSSESDHKESAHAVAAKTTWQKIKGKFTEYRAQGKITNTDIWFTLLFLEMGVSTLLAPYKYEALWGSRGRYQGFVLWTMFYAAYILITRFYKYKKWHLTLILIFSLGPCVLGIVQFFTFDPFDFFSHTEPQYRYIYASTIGNINTYSAYTGMMLALSTVTFVLAKDRKTEILSGIIMVVHCFAHIMSISDNTVLSTAALFSILPILTWKSTKQFIKTIFSLAILLFAMIISGMIYQTGMMTMNQYGNSLLISIGCISFAKWILILLLFTIAAILYIRKKGQNINNIISKLRKVWIVMLIVGLITSCGVLIYANIPSNSVVISKLPYALQKILIFNDNWGTGRGLSWRLGFQYYLGDSTLAQKIFGNGLDTYYIIMMDRYKNIMRNEAYGIFDNAHNEYIEYLMTIGADGLILYLLMIVNAVKAGFSKQESPFIAMTTAVFVYLMQASVNIAVPIITPIFIIFLSISSGKRNIKVHSCDSERTPIE